MDIDFNLVESTPVTSISSIEDQETTPKACNQRTKQAAEVLVEEGDDDDDNDNDSETNNMCPLFMNGLPKNFASNPQLAAIASLMNDDDDDDGDCAQEDEEQKNPDNGNDNDECNTKNHNIMDHKKKNT
jgi:hypothetical protein